MGARGEQDEAFEMASDLNAGERPEYVSGDYMCICPAHADGSPSLAVRWNGKRLVYHCYAGCEFRDVARAIRDRGVDPLTGGRMGEPAAPRRTSPAKPDKEALFHANHTYDPYGDPKWVEDRRAWWLQGSAKPGIGRYVYRDLEGRPLMTVTRSMEPHRFKPGLHKVLVPVTPWRNAITGRMDMPFKASPDGRPPYGAETVRTRPGRFVLAAEGEKCRDALERLCRGRMPTISTYGSTPYLTDLSCIAGRTLIVFRDSDEPGVKYGGLLGAEHAGATIVMEAPAGPEGRPDGWDVADWEGTPDATPETWTIHTGNELPRDIAREFVDAMGGTSPVT